MNAFFYAYSFATFLLLHQADALAACPLAPKHAQSSSVTVIDGDTVKTKDGLRIRFSAINTPEIGRANKPAQALGVEAKKALQTMLDDQPMRFVMGENDVDKYGRSLAHVFTSDGQSIEEKLIAEGLAFHVAIPPNLDMALCLREAEINALRANKGVWSDPFWAPLLATDTLRGGFSLVEGKIEKVTKTKRATYIDFTGNLTLRVDAKDYQYFTEQWWRELLNKRWLAKGWVIDRKNIKPPFKRWMMTIGHPAMLLPVP